MAHYAEVFAPRPGACFRYVVDNTGHGRPMPCPEPAPWRGTFVDGRGRPHAAEACGDHMADLREPTSSLRPPAPTDAASAPAR